MAASLSFPSESLSESQELCSFLLNASSSAEIVSCCQSVEDFVRRHTRDQSRHFYVVSFPVLLKKIFGFDDATSNGWISHDMPQVASAIIDLLSPSGTLFTSVFDADAGNLVQYAFPLERLPRWIRNVLLSENGFLVLIDLIPALFRGRVKESQLQLNIFEFYMFWFAYYAVCQDKNTYVIGQDECGDVMFTARRGSRFYLEKWKSSLPKLHGTSLREGHGKYDPSPYLRLVNLYLQYFLPVKAVSTPGPVDTSLGAFVYHTFVQFWCVTNDPLPVPLRVLQALGLQSSCENLYEGLVPINACHTESLRVLVYHVHKSLCASSEEWVSVAMFSAYLPLKLYHPMIRNLHGLSVLSVMLQRPLYRFILRTLKFWPIGASVKDAENVIDLWLDYLQPWELKWENDDLPGTESGIWSAMEGKISRNRNGNYSPLPRMPSLNKVGRSSTFSKSLSEDSQSTCKYEHKWRSFVLANFPFYSSLLIHFLSFAHKFVHIDVKEVLQMTHKVLIPLASSNELRSLLQKTETTYNATKVRNAINNSNNMQKTFSIISEQLQDWESDIADVEDEVHTTSRLESKKPSLRFFSNNVIGGQQMLKFLILRAEASIQSDVGEKMLHNLKLLGDLKQLLTVIFGVPESDCSLSSNLEQDKSLSIKQPGLGRHTWADIKYKGDWMKRPIEDDEIALLVRFLVRISDCLNHLVGLDYEKSTTFANGSENSRGCRMVLMPLLTDFSDVTEIHPKLLLCDWNRWKNTLWHILCIVSNCCLYILLLVQKVLRKKGIRINLRFLAKKKVLLLIFICTILFKLTKGFMSYIYFILGSVKFNFGLCMYCC